MDSSTEACILHEKQVVGRFWLVKTARVTEPDCQPRLVAGEVFG